MQVQLPYLNPVSFHRRFYQNQPIRKSVGLFSTHINSRSAHFTGTIGTMLARLQHILFYRAGARFVVYWRRGLLKLLLAGVAMQSGHAVAGPAPWYWWYSKYNGKAVCEQTSPGEGWERGGPAYRDANCKHRKNVFLRGQREAEKDGKHGSPRRAPIFVPDNSPLSAPDDNL